MAVDLTQFEQINLMDSLPEEEREAILEDLGHKVVEEFNADWDSRKEWWDNNQKWLDMVTQYVKHKNWPWPKSSNVKYPLVAMAALQFQSRIYPMMVNGTRIAKARTIGLDQFGDKKERAERISQHMSFQLLEEMSCWEEDHDRMLFIVPIIGSAYKKVFFDPHLGRNSSVLVDPADFVVNYYADNLESAARISHVLWEDEVTVEEKIRMGIYADFDWDPEAIEDPQNQERLSKDEADKRIGISKPNVGVEGVPLTFIEQHRRYDLDGDGYKEPVIATVHYQTGQVVRVVPRYALENVEMDDEGNILRITPDQYFVKYGFIPNPESGIYDIGFGQLLGPLNSSANTILNQLVDAGTLSNLQGGFLGRGIRLKKGQERFGPGEWKQVQNTGEDLAKSIYPLPVKEPSHVLFSLLGMIVEFGERLGSVSGSLTGENPGQNQAATTTLAVMEQGLKVLSSIFKRLHRGFKKELRQLYVLNNRYLEDSQYFAVLDPGQEQAAEIAQKDYSLLDFDVIPEGDPNAVSMSQKLMKQQVLEQYAQYGHVNTKEMTRRALQASEQDNIEALMEAEERGEDPKITIRRMELEQERELKLMELAVKKTQVESEGVKDQAVAILAMAKAQSEEVNREIKMLQAELKNIGEFVRTTKDVQAIQQGEQASQQPPPEEPVQETDMTPTSTGSGEMGL